MTEERRNSYLTIPNVRVVSDVGSSVDNVEDDDHVDFDNTKFGGHHGKFLAKKKHSLASDVLSLYVIEGDLNVLNSGSSVRSKINYVASISDSSSVTGTLTFKIILK